MIKVMALELIATSLRQRPLTLGVLSNDGRWGLSMHSSLFKSLSALFVLSVLTAPLIRAFAPLPSSIQLSFTPVVEAF